MYLQHGLLKLITLIYVAIVHCRTVFGQQTRGSDIGMCIGVHAFHTIDSLFYLWEGAMARVIEKPMLMNFSLMSFSEESRYFKIRVKTLSQLQRKIK